MIVMVVAGIGLIARLVQLQIINHADYSSEAQVTRAGKKPVNVRRGAILDTKGYPLAASINTYELMVERRAWEDPVAALAEAQAISEIVGTSPEELIRRVAETDSFEVAVARDLNYMDTQRLKELDLSRIRFVEGARRVYPEGSIAAQVIGIVGLDDIGLTGLEADLNGLLSGQTGTVTFERDGLGQPIGIGDKSEVSARHGADIVLTIDRFIQAVTEQELDETIDRHEAKGGSIIVLDPSTGGILAMASRPSFNLISPDLTNESGLGPLRNRAISDQYEPGSVFKLIPMAAALDQGLVNPDTEWMDTGAAAVGGWTIYNWDFSTNGVQTATDILAKSLNTGAVWLSEMLGHERLYEYIQRFGFGQPTGVELGGEVGGHVRTPTNDPAGWRPVDGATNSFGQGISVTPLQVASAIATIANDGAVMRPTLVKEIVTESGREKVDSQQMRQAISPETASVLREMMGTVAERIPGDLLDVPGHKIGGKSGTAQIVKGNDSYEDEVYISSFGGIAPLEDPAIAVLVKIDEPQGLPWGTVVAAPAFSNIAQAVLTYYKISPTESTLVQHLQP